MRSDATGELLGRHHCLERLGDGPLGISYRARVYGIGEFVKEFSLTAIDRDLCGDVSFRVRLVHAANRAAQLGGERLQHLYEVDQVRGKYFVVSELVAGVELGLLLELLRATNEPLGMAAGTLIALEIAEALAGAHSRTDIDQAGVLHLGVSPKTVVIDESGETRVLHTGLYAALVRPGWDPRGLPRAFLSPEVLAGALATPAADVFSVGQILHEALGFLPEAERMRAIIRRATDPDPARRYPTMLDLRAAIEPHCDRAAGRARLAHLAERYATKPPPLEKPTAVEVLLPPVVPPRSDWETGEIDRAETNVLDSQRPRTTVLDEAIEFPSLASEISERLQRLPPISLEMKAPVVSLPPLAPPTTLSLAALRAPPSRALPVLVIVAVSLAVLAAIGTVVLLLLHKNGNANGNASANGNVNASANASANVNVNANVEAPRGLQQERPIESGTPLLRIDVSPARGRVYLDGLDAGSSPLERRLSVGKHVVVVVAEGYTLHRETVTLGRGEARLNVVLEPARLPEDLEGEAGLKVRCATEGTYRIFVDGADTGRNCPNDTRIEIAPGVHALGLYAPAEDRLIDVHKHPNVPLLGRSTRIYLAY